jgi:hypothetical protein
MSRVEYTRGLWIAATGFYPRFKSRLPSELFGSDGAAKNMRSAD